MPQLRARLAALGQVGSTSTMLALGANFARSAQDIAPSETGALRRSISVRMAVPRAVDIGAGGPSVGYAPAQEFGAKRHVIPGRPMLRFYWKKRGRMFRGPMVNHPGNRAQPFFRPVMATFNLALGIRGEVVALWNYGGRSGMGQFANPTAMGLAMDRWHSPYANIGGSNPR
jgi:hypothetical protein